jgi:hypothetical protein
MNENRIAELSQLLDDKVNEGESFSVRKEDDELEIVAENEDARILAREQPGVYGRLLALNEQLDQAGGFLGSILYVLIAWFCLAIHMSWIEAFAGMPVEQLRSFWLYLAVAVVGFLIHNIIRDFLASFVYRNNRDDLHMAIRQHGVDSFELLARIEDVSAMKAIAKHLKRDRTLGLDI